MSFLEKLSTVKLVAMDVDGVLTDGTVLLLENGQQARTMHTKDGYAIQLAVKKGIDIVVISGASDEAVKMRLEKLGISQIYQGVENKKQCLDQIAADKHIPLDAILFMGDDMPDWEVMSVVGCSCCPADACAEIKQISHYISPFHGGQSFVRDVLEKLLGVNGLWHHHNTTRSL